MPDLSSEEQQCLKALKARRARLLAQRVAALEQELQELLESLPDDTATAAYVYDLVYDLRPLVAMFHKHGLTLASGGWPVLVEDA